MGVIIPEDISNVTFIWTSAGAPRNKVTSMGCYGPVGSPSSAQTMADDVYNLFTAASRPGNAAGFINTWFFQGVTVVQTQGGLPVLGSHLVPITGSRTGPSTASNTALIVKKNTSLGGRANRGRFFVPAAVIDETVVDQNGFLSPAATGTEQARWTAFYVALTGAGYVPVVLHSDATTPTTINSFSVESQVGTQRRRMR